MANKTRYLHPRYWPTWLGLGFFHVIVRLPHRMRLAVGVGLGQLAFRVAGRRRHIVETNIRLCFPDLTPGEQRALVVETFRSGGISIVETAISWLTGGRSVFDRATLVGIEHLQDAQAKGRGVILLGTHMSTLDLAGTVMSRHFNVDVMYRANKNALIEDVMTTGRGRMYPHPIERGNVRQVIANIKAGHIVWYGADQDYGARNAVFAPFFGVPAATTTALSRIAKITGAPIVPYTHYRINGGEKYEVVLFPPLENFPSGSEAEDAKRINGFVEDCVRRAPEQYWWFHRRFKTPPPGEPGVY